ncbi:hypothetical protein ACFX1R_032859 [Malus domestica]
MRSLRTPQAKSICWMQLINFSLQSWLASSLKASWKIWSKNHGYLRRTEAPYSKSARVWQTLKKYRQKKVEWLVGNASARMRARAIASGNSKFGARSSRKYHWRHNWTIQVGPLRLVSKGSPLVI